MPAPHRRNRGESLAHHVDSGARGRAVADGRDRLVATRARKDAKWEEAAARLSPLEQRAAEARRDHERGKQYERYDTAVRQGKARPPVVVLEPQRPPRYWLGFCVRCDFEMWVGSLKPRLPICRRCRS